MDSRVVVIGGGVIGAACTYELAAAGLGVVLVERETIAHGASGAAPGLVGPLVEAMSGKPSAALARAALPAASALIERVESETGLSTGFARTGSLHVASTESEAAELRAWTGRTPEGLDVEWLDEAALRDAEPGLAPFLGALYCPAESQLYPADYTRALVAAAGRRGAEIRTGIAATALLGGGERVTGVETSAGPIGADHVIIAAGAWSGEMLLPDGRRLPIRPLRGARLALAPVAPANRHLVYAEHGDLGPKPNGEVWVGATEEEAGFLPGPTAADIAELAAAAPRMFPALAGARFVEARSGFRPTAPDYVPIIGPTAPGLTVATGHWRKGVMFAAITGRLVRQSVLGEATDFDLEPFSPSRF